jgi:hypothetical protein
MGFDPTVRTETFGGSDKSWIRTRRGLADMLPITLDVSGFSTNHVVNGKLPSGIALAKLTATGLYVPYGGNVNEVQTITVDATGGTYTISYGGDTTSAIAFNATAAAVQSALETGIDEIDVGDVRVTGGPGAAGGGTPYTLTFGGQYAGTNVAQVTTTATLTGGAATATVATGTGGAAGGTTGVEVFRGHLFEDFRINSGPNTTPTPATAADGGAALYHIGIVIESKLPTFGGTNGGVIDADGKAQNPNIIYV